MPLLAQLCMIVVTIAVVVMAGVTIRLMLQTKTLIETANRALAELPALIEDTKRASARADELLIAFTRITGTAQAAAARFQGLATRSSSLAASLLDEVEQPVSQVVGLIRGIRAGASHLIRGWQSRADGRTRTQEGVEHVGEQRWLDDGGSAAGSGDRGRAGTGAGAQLG